MAQNINFENTFKTASLIRANSEIGGSLTGSHRFDQYRFRMGHHSQLITAGVGRSPIHSPTNTATSVGTVSSSLKALSLQGGVSALSTNFASSRSVQVTRLTNNGGSYVPHISGSSIVWRGSDGSDNEIFLYDGNRVSQLTNNSTYDSDPQVSDAYVAWINGSGNEAEIMLYRRATGTTTQLTENGLRDDELQVSGSTVAWTTTYRREDGTTERDIRFSVNGGNPVSINTRGDFDDSNPKVSGSFIAFERDQIDGYAEDGIYLYNTTTGTTLRLSSTASYPVSLGGISGSNVVWTEGYSSNIFFFNGSHTLRLTSGEWSDRDPQISGTNIVWQRLSAAGGGIYFYNGSSVNLLSDRGKNARISGSNIVWQDDKKLFLYDGTATREIAQYNANDRAEALLSVSNSGVVWLGYSGDPSIGYDVYSAKITEQERLSQGVANGLTGYLTRLESAFSNRVLLNRLPLIGNQLRNSPASRFISALRSKISSTFEAAAPTNSNAVRQSLFNALGNGAGGLNILRDLNNDGRVNINDVQLRVQGADVEFRLNLGQAFAPFNVALDRSLGLPRLGVTLGGNARVQADYNLNLKFGYQLSGSDISNFYVDTADAKELTVGLKVSTPGLNAAGSLGFLKVRATDQGTALTGQISVNLRDSTDADTRLTLTELQNLDDAGLLNTSLTGRANLQWKLATSFPVQARFPSLSTVLRIDWSLNSGNLDPGQPRTLGGTPKIEFRDVTLDLGSFFRSFVSPIFGEIQKVTRPIAPIVNFLTKPLPVISKLAKRNVTMIDIAELAVKANPRLPKPNFGYIRAAAEITQLVNGIPRGPLPAINLGSFSLGSVDVRSPNFNLNGASPQRSKVAPGWRAQLQGNSALSFLDRTQNAKSAAGKFGFPILTDPNTVFSLLLGKKDTRLFTYRMPTLSFKGAYSQFTPILGPLGVTITGTVGANINFEFGFDAFGLNQYFTSNNISDVFTGFYIDADPRKPAHVNVFAGLDAGPGVNLAIADFTIAGGLVGTVDFRLKDDGDLKVRANELVNNLRGGPLGIFTTSGAVIAGLTARASVIGVGSFEENIASVTLFTYGGNPGFKQKSGQANQSTVQKYARLGVTALMGPAPLAVGLVRKYGPTLVNAIERAGVGRNLQNAARKGRQTATRAAAVIDRELGTARNQAIAQIRRAGQNPVRVPRRVEQITVQKAAPAIRKVFRRLRF